MNTFSKIFVIIMALALCSCKPRVITQIRTEYVYRDVHDTTTLVQHDSTWIREYIKGDTVRITEYRDRYLYRDRIVNKTDTLVKVDSVLVEKQVPVEKPLSWGKRARLDLFWWLLAACIALAGWTFRKPLLALIRRLIGV